jgi:hypothetical protein
MAAAALAREGIAAALCALIVRIATDDESSVLRSCPSGRTAVALTALRALSGVLRLSKVCDLDALDFKNALGCALTLPAVALQRRWDLELATEIRESYRHRAGEELYFWRDWDHPDDFSEPLARAVADSRPELLEAISAEVEACLLRLGFKVSKRPLGDDWREFPAAAADDELGPPASKRRKLE